MNIYLLTRPDSCGWDEYDATVVAAESEEKARLIHPNDYVGKGEWWKDIHKTNRWSLPERLEVKLLGVAEKGLPEGVILSSYNAG